MQDVIRVRDAVWAKLDLNFFRIRMERLMPCERDFLRAMAVDIEDAPCRASLIRKGMVYSPQHGLLAYTVPLFGTYLKRRGS